MRRQYTDRFHSGAACRGQPGRRIFDDKAACGGDAQALGREQERLRIGFAALDVFRANDRLDQRLQMRGMHHGFHVEARRRGDDGVAPALGGELRDPVLDAGQQIKAAFQQDGAIAFFFRSHNLLDLGSGLIEFEEVSHDLFVAQADGGLETLDAEVMAQRREGVVPRFPVIGH